jgi:zinc transporter 1/2/3
MSVISDSSSPVEPSEVDPCDEIDTGEYDMPMHIASVFILLAVSFLGTLIPIIGKRSRRLRMSDYMFAIAKNFGTGIILATGFVHMFCPAAENLTNECLPELFHEDYDAWAGLIALVICLVIQFIQTMAVDRSRKNEEAARLREPLIANEDRSGASAEGKTLPPELGSAPVGHHEHGDDGHVHSLLLDPENTAGSASRRVSTYMLELGIATHSVIIGVCLGVAREDEFTSLLIALTFHQFFEGIALSTTVLDSGFKTLKQPIFVVIFYSLTTPMGIAIGIAVSSAYKANGVATLLIQGIFDALSAGILIYDGLVNMLNNNITQNKGFSALSTARKAWLFASLWVGAIIMAIIGRWA